MFASERSMDCGPRQGKLATVLNKIRQPRLPRTTILPKTNSSAGTEGVRETNWRPPRKNGGAGFERSGVSVSCGSFAELRVRMGLSTWRRGPTI